MNKYVLYKIRFLNDDIVEKLYIMGAVILSIRSVIGLSALENQNFSILTYIAYICVILKILATPVSKRNLAIYIALFLLGIKICSITRNSIVLNNLIFIIGAINIDRRKVLKYVSIATIITSSLVGLLSLFGYIPISNLKYGMCFGFVNPNGLMSFIIAFSILYIASSYEEISTMLLLNIFIINVIFGILLQARTGLVISFLLFSFLVILKNPQNVNKFINLKIEYAYVIMITVVFLLSVFYEQLEWGTFIDYIISGRFSQSHWYYKMYGIPVFGAYIAELQSNYKFYHLLLDCGYMRLFINYGWVYAIIYIASHFIMLRQARINNQKGILVALLGFAFLMIVENGGIGINFNMSLILLSMLLPDDKVLCNEK